ncbi:MAG: L-lactate permease [Negativicutes bacterium]|nr:L-lactate permease [Negativicutes bacterium]
MALSFALLPIVWLFISLGYFRLAAHQACTLGLFLSIAICVSFLQMPYNLAFEAALEGAILAFVPILWVIFAAFYTYNICVKSGAMTRIKNIMANLSGDRRIQVLAIAWGFGGFFESVAGFGTAVAIPASILVALGFEPFFAAIVCLLANTVAVAFGVVGIPITMLAKITGLPVLPLSLAAAAQLTPFVILVPFLLVFTVTKSLAGFRGVWLTTLLAGLSFAGAQYITAKYVGPELPAIIGSVFSLATIIACVKLMPGSQTWRFPGEDGRQYEAAAAGGREPLSSQCKIWAPYLLLLFFALVTSRLSPPLNGLLSQAKTTFVVYSGTGGAPLSIDWLLTPGTLIMLAAILGGLIQGCSCRTLATTLGETLSQLQTTALTVISIVSMSKVLAYSGTIGFIAMALSDTSGLFYPAIAPLIGMLGTFITGSDTSANILFGLLQKNVALQIGTDPIWIAAANTSGACIGKLISPQNIAIAAVATGLTGKEGDILNIMIKYAGIFTVGLGVITYVFAT